MSALRVAVVTGASSGIGAEFVEQLTHCEKTELQKFDELWIIARRKEQLEQVREQSKCGNKIRILVMDLTEDPEQFVQMLEEVQPEIGLLVNCAGYGIGGPFSRSGRQEACGMVRLNCEALTGMCHICIPYMKEESRIINIASSAAFFPQPDFAVYAASKAYVLNFSRALGAELTARKITVTAVCPGPVETPFFQISEKYEKSREYKKKFRVSPDKVVRKALRDSEKGKSMSVYGGTMKLLQVISKVLPHSLIIKIIGNS